MARKLTHKNGQFIFIGFSAISPLERAALAVICQVSIASTNKASLIKHGPHDAIKPF
jgi:hypothetical protein